MSPSAQKGLVFTATPRGETAKPLVPEQAAEFDLHLRNQSGAPQTVLSLQNLSTPTIEIFDAQGRSLGEFSPADRRRRNVGGEIVRTPRPDRTVTLAPGQEETIWANVWSHTDTLPPGAYSFQATHQAQGALSLRSAPVPFRIVPAQVEAAALGYDKPLRTYTVLAWLAIAQGGETARLLIRLSGATGHSAIQLGATPHGEFPLHSRVAVSAEPPDSALPSVGWAAVVSGARLQLVEHNLSTPYWRPPAVTLPVSDAVPVPRFPNRGPAIFLATGSSSKGPVLIGVKAEEHDPVLKPWSVSLPVLPSRTLCAFLMEGAITVLLASDDGRTSRLSRIDVSEEGQVTAAARVVRESPNEVLAMVTDLRAAEPLSFVVLEADRQAHDRVTLVKIPLGGEARSTRPVTLAGWPHTNGAPDRLAAVDLETAPDGTPWIAVTDQRGDLIGGPMDSPLAMLREARIKRAAFPHIGALDRSVTISCFNQDGTMYHSGAGGNQ